MVLLALARLELPLLSVGGDFARGRGGRLIRLLIFVAAVMLELLLLGYGLLGGHNHLDVLVLLRQCLLIVLCHYEIIEFDQ